MTFANRAARIAVVCAVLTLTFLTGNLFAQTHVVSSGELQKQVSVASQSRQHNLDVVQKFLSSGSAQKAMNSAHVDPVQVKTAVSTLNDQELEQLAARSQKAQADFAAGTLSDRDLLIIVLAVVALVLIIVAVR